MSALTEALRQERVRPEDFAECTISQLIILTHIIADAMWAKMVVMTSGVGIYPKPAERPNFHGDPLFGTDTNLPTVQPRAGVTAG